MWLILVGRRCITWRHIWCLSVECWSVCCLSSHVPLVLCQDQPTVFANQMAPHHPVLQRQQRIDDNMNGIDHIENMITGCESLFSFFEYAYVVAESEIKSDVTVGYCLTVLYFRWRFQSSYYRFLVCSIQGSDGTWTGSDVGNGAGVDVNFSPCPINELFLYRLPTQ